MNRKIIIMTVVLLLIVSLFTGCKTDTKEAATSKEETTTKVTETPKDEATPPEPLQSRKISFLSIWPEDDNDAGYLMSELSRQYAEYAEAEGIEGFEFDFQYMDITQVKAHTSVLMSSNDLPDICTYDSGASLIDVIESGQIIDIDASFTELGIRDSLDDGAVSLLETLVGGIGLYDIPMGLNVEGFWYNKALFEQAGITTSPKTWDEFMADCEKLKVAGITPIVQGGADQWPMTRVLNAYLVRSVGLDATTKAMNGEAKWTSPEYVAAAQMFADMSEKGYFAVGMNTIDYGTAASMLMDGQAAMLYNGSWFTSDLNSDTNTAGADGIGFFNVPLVNDTSTLDDYSMNCGSIFIIAANKYDDALKDYMKFVFPRIGDFAINELGSFKGFSITNMPEDASEYTKLVAETLKTTKGSFLWFEAMMDIETTTLARANAGQLYTGEMSPEEYMQALQESTDRNME